MSLRTRMRNTPITAGITLMAGAVMWASTVNTIEITSGPAPSVTHSTTGRVKVDRCIDALKVYGANPTDQTADKATVTCSAIVKDKDAAALYGWIKAGHGKRDYALYIVG
jgi:hypothetical protein